MGKKKILSVGIATLDIILQVTELPTKEGKFVANDLSYVGGGPAATASVTISKLGIESHLLARVGSDNNGQNIIKELEEYNVNTSNIIIPINSETTISVILVDDNGERMIINYPSKSLPQICENMIIPSLKQYSAVLADIRWLYGSTKILKQAQAQGIPTVIDVDVTPEDISSIIKYGDHLVFSKPGLQKYLSTDNPLNNEKFIEASLRKISNEYNGIPYVTAGNNGCYWLKDNQLFHEQAFKIDVKDTTGAGDVFHGAFIAGLVLDLKDRELIKFANAAAALKCSQSGGRKGIVDYKKVVNFLKSY